ncbi:MAG: DUF1572 domain-containing protein [Chloroflexi bacterium]|nr:DUF1572 domain-containing protein [Chloroflexota bacterium]
MLPELATALTELDDLIDQAKQIIQTMDPAGLDYAPGAEMNSIGAIATHIAGSLKWYLGEVIAQRDMRRDRDAEFRARGKDARTLAQMLDEAREFAREILETITPAMLDETRQARTRTVIVRQGVMHIVAHTAQHVGQIEITAQLWKMKRDA